MRLLFPEHGQDMEHGWLFSADFLMFFDHNNVIVTTLGRGSQTNPGGGWGVRATRYSTGQRPWTRPVYYIKTRAGAAAGGHAGFGSQARWRVQYELFLLQQ